MCERRYRGKGQMNVNGRISSSPQMRASVTSRPPQEINPMRPWEPQKWSVCRKEMNCTCVRDKLWPDLRTRQSCKQIDRCSWRQRQWARKTGPSPRVELHLGIWHVIPAEFQLSVGACAKSVLPTTPRLLTSAEHFSEEVCRNHGKIINRNMASGRCVRI